MTHLRISALILATVALLLSLSAAAFAQETTGRISGRVIDPAGAVVSNADITLTSVATSEERKAQSDEEGNYTFTQLQPGVYNLSVRGQGFKEHIIESVEVSVNDRRV